MKSFQDLIADFMESMRLKNMSPSTICSYRDSAVKFIKFIETGKINDLREVTKEALQNYQSYLQKERETKPHFSLETIHVRLRGLKRFFEFLQETHQILYNPTDVIVFPKLGQRLPKDILTRDEVNRILLRPDINTPDGIRDRALLETLYSTGIRLSECAHLEIGDVDYQGGYLRVNQGKGAKDRMAPLGKIASQWLQRYIQEVRPELLKQQPDGLANKVLWISHLGKRLSIQLIIILVRNYGQKAGIKKRVTVHTWRRTLATHLLQAGVNPIYIQEILGHERTSSLNRYIKIAAIEIKQTHQKTHPRERVTTDDRREQIEKSRFDRP